MKSTTDLRVVKTKKALVQAMMESLREKAFEDVTVQSLCDKALVRRATFYTHFADKFDLLSYTVRTQYQAFPSFAQVGSEASPREIYHQMVADAVNFMAEHQVIFRSMINSELLHVMLNIIRSELERDLLPAIERSMQRQAVNGLNPQFVFHFYLHGIFGSFTWWVQEESPISKEALILQIQSMMNLP